MSCDFTFCSEIYFISPQDNPGMNNNSELHIATSNYNYTPVLLVAITLIFDRLKLNAKPLWKHSCSTTTIFMDNTENYNTLYNTIILEIIQNANSAILMSDQAGGKMCNIFNHHAKNVSPCKFLPSNKGLIYSTTQGESGEIKNPNCISEDFNTYRLLGCYTSHISLEIVRRKMNITLDSAEDPVPDAIDEDDRSNGLHICILCNPEDFLEEIDQQNPIFYIDNYRKFYLIYCSFTLSNLVKNSNKRLYRALGNNASYKNYTGLLPYQYQTGN
ncbi:hypothetical protein Fcan01_16872 [Folsomia candida]|uniref:Uncharacterized protein n=1 Tax=Folsomia candida TaxID=158441 RepID=A0A226DRW3_FOLCA|nr:hypothetical protein Fcan01_16872 [Folsomia candida]